MNEFETVRNVQIVKAGMTRGTVMRLNICHALAPSILAASITSVGTARMAAI